MQLVSIRSSQRNQSLEPESVPYTSAAQQADRVPIKGQKSMTEWSKTQLGPVPKVAGKP
jgi:hypothetical protein